MNNIDLYYDIIIYHKWTKQKNYIKRDVQNSSTFEILHAGHARVRTIVPLISSFDKPKCLH